MVIKVNWKGVSQGQNACAAVDRLEDLGASTGFLGKTRPAKIIFSPRVPKGPIREIVETEAILQQAGDHHGGTFFQHKYFYEVVTKGRKVDVSVEDGVKAVLIGLAAQVSIATKQVVSISL